MRGRSLQEQVRGAGAQPGNPPGSNARVLGVGDGPGQQLEGLEEGPSLGQSGADKDLVGDRRNVGAHTGKVLAIRENSRGIATCGPGDRRCKVRPLAEICSGSEDMGLAGVWEESIREIYHYLSRQERVDFRVREGHFQSIVITVAASLTSPPQIFSPAPPPTGIER